MKKLISLLSAVALFATLLTTVAFADANNKYYIEESRSGNLVTLHYVLVTNQTITKAQGTFDFSGAAALGATITATKGSSSDVTTFNVNATSYKGAWVAQNVSGTTGTFDLGTVVIDISGVSDNFTIPTTGSTASKLFNVKNGSTDLTSSFTDTATNYEVTVGGGDPVVAEKDTTTGVVTFDYTNATQPASDVLDGQKIKLFSETFTGVTANTRFRVNHNDTYKIFGSTIGEYLGIGGSGTLSGTLGVAVLFPEGDNSDFTISKID